MAATREPVRPDCCGAACIARPARHYRTMGGSPRRAAFVYSGRGFPQLTGQWFPSVAAFCRAAEISATMVYGRVHEGWPLLKALDTPRIEISRTDGLIYLVTRRRTGERYVGLTLVSMQARWRQHARGAVRRGSPLARAIDDDGPGGFTIEPLELGIAAANLADRERHWIRELDTLLPNGLNRHRGGAMGGGGQRAVAHEGETFRSVALASATLAKRHSLTESAAHQRLRKGASLKTPLKVVRTRGKNVAGTFLWSRWRAMRNNVSSELGDAWQDWERFAADLATLAREDRLIRKDRTQPWGPDNFEIQPASFVDHPKVGTLHWQRWRTMLRRAEKPGDRGVVEEWRDFDRFEADIAPSYGEGAVMIPKDWHQPWGPDNFDWGTQSDLSRLVGVHGAKHVVHGDHRSPVYKRWQSMKNDARRHGFEIDQAWLDYPTFRAAVGAGVMTGLILMRPDRTQAFGPDNFALVTKDALKAFPTNRSHGQTGTPLHERWVGMRARAASSPEGCDPRWADFPTFAADVGDARPDCDFERMDGALPYGPANFRWIDRAARRAAVEQARSAKRMAAQAKREAQAVIVEGVTFRGLYALAAAYAVPAATVCLRVRQGMTPQEAVLTPNKSMAVAQPIHLDGQDFPSKSQALRYVTERYGIPRNTMQLRLNAGLTFEMAAHKPLRKLTRAR
ncbi:MAG: GIY-YIG nuclease family protein [Sphingomonas sp.]|jgi:hypothetical protein|uniref:GIY-YIG nuclease family protein n=1 Tax=Sphingomonas sp. TaxID=28214 RepID=UPI003564DB91